MNRRITISFAAAILAVLALHEPALSQTCSVQQPDAWWQKVEAQLIASLDAPLERMQRQALTQLVEYAENCGDQFIFAASVPKLLEVYATDSRKANRLDALAALRAIGTEEAMAGLSQLVSDESLDDVRRLTMAALQEHASTSGTH